MADFHKPTDNNEPTFDRPRPPQPEEELIRVLRQHGKVTDSFPSNYHQAAMVWMGLMEPQKFPQEAAEWEPRASKQEPNAGRWMTPYIDRLRTSLHIFLDMSQPERAFVVHHINRGIPYRGDGIDMFREIIKNTDKMLEAVKEHGRGPSTNKHPNGTLPVAYTNEVLVMMKKALKGMTNLPYDKNEKLADD